MAPATDEERPSGLDGKQIRVLILFAVIAGCWMGSGFLSSLLGGIPSMDTLIALCAVVLLPLCGVINWSGIAKIRTGACCFCLAGALLSVRFSFKRMRPNSWQTRFPTWRWGRIP